MFGYFLSASLALATRFCRLGGLWWPASIAIVPFSPIAWARTSRAKRQTGHRGGHRGSHQGVCFHGEYAGVCELLFRGQGLKIKL